MRPAALLLPFVLCQVALSAALPAWTARRTLDLGRAWAGHPVGFVFTVRNNQQYVGWYDADRRMVFAQRSLDSARWTFHKTKEITGWDSHNYIALAFDRAGHLHVAANMHCSPLRYWRSEKPEDVSTLKPVHRMTGHESGCTYPQFFHDKTGRLLFMFRIGGSGSGRRYVNVYDEKARTWTRLISKPLLSGLEGGASMNAYPIGLRADRNGLFHIAWVWRDNPDCSTNHDLCYARSEDFKTWTSSSGKKLELPITLKTAEIVAPVPARAGLANFGGGLAFDQKDRPTITYTRFDRNGHNQIYAARLEEKGWQTYQLTDWKHRWNFRGGGCIRSEISWSALRPAGAKFLALNYRHPKAGSGMQRFDAETLKPVGALATVKSPWPDEVRRVRSKLPGMGVRMMPRRLQRPGEEPAVHILRWETLGVNRDRPRKKVPPPSKLQVIELVRQQQRPTQTDAAGSR